MRWLQTSKKSNEDLYFESATGMAKMTPRKGALARPEGKKRAKPGTKGEGDYFRIVVRSKDEFVAFRYQDVGEKGHIMRLLVKGAAGLGIRKPG